jgi:hypothetical protein
MLNRYLWAGLRGIPQRNCHDAGCGVLEQSSCGQSSASASAQITLALTSHSWFRLLTFDGPCRVTDPLPLSYVASFFVDLKSTTNSVRFLFSFRSVSCITISQSSSAVPKFCTKKLLLILISLRKLSSKREALHVKTLSRSLFRKAWFEADHHIGV